MFTCVHFFFVKIRVLYKLHKLKLIYGITYKPVFNVILPLKEKSITAVCYDKYFKYLPVPVEKSIILSKDKIKQHLPSARKYKLILFLYC